MLYTQQAQLDENGQGQRWGCAFTCCVNLAEDLRGRRATMAEVDAMLGHAVRRGFIAHANYVNHANPNPLYTPPGWDASLDLEYHYYVVDWCGLMAACCSTLGIPLRLVSYYVLCYRFNTGGVHFCLQTPRGAVINPDASVNISNMVLIEKRRVVP